MIEQVTSQSQIESYLKQQIERRTQAIIYALEYIGVTCINEARDSGTYIDRTGNLRNSVGYVIVKDGHIIKGGDFHSGEGGEKGKAQIQKLVAEYPHGIALIVVAGMNYAAYVEAKNYNVLTSAELLAEQLIPTLMKELGFNTAA